MRILLGYRLKGSFDQILYKFLVSTELFLGLFLEHVDLLYGEGVHVGLLHLLDQRVEAPDLAVKKLSVIVDFCHETLLAIDGASHNEVVLLFDLLDYCGGLLKEDVKVRAGLHLLNFLSNIRLMER